MNFNKADTKAYQRLKELNEMFNDKTFDESNVQESLFLTGSDFYYPVKEIGDLNIGAEQKKLKQNLAKHNGVVEQYYKKHGCDYKVFGSSGTLVIDDNTDPEILSELQSANVIICERLEIKKSIVLDNLKELYSNVFVAKSGSYFVIRNVEKLSGCILAKKNTVLVVDMLAREHQLDGNDIKGKPEIRSYKDFLEKQYIKVGSIDDYSL